ncbi:MAG: tetratricopeptide repeat protein, partial [Nitrospirae bacterium]|nr:tetratricopeptide repeat protein [Nitrospirota bacterium]
VTGYHAVNLIIHIINALLVYWLALLTFFRVAKWQRDKVAEGQDAPSTVNGQQSINLIALFSALLFISHPIQTQAVTYLVQRFTSLATLFYLLSLAMYVKFRIQNIEHRTQNTDKRQKIFSLSSVFWYLGSVFSAVLAMKTKEIAFTLPIIIVLYEIFFFSKSQNSETSGSIQNSPLPPFDKGGIKGGYSLFTVHCSLFTHYASRFFFLIPFFLTMLIIPLSYIGADTSAGDLLSDVSETARLQTDMSRLDYLFTQFRVIVTYIRLLFLPSNQNLDYDYPVYNSFFNPNVFLSFLLLLSILGLAVYLVYRSKFKVQSSTSVDYSLSTVHCSRLTAFGIFWFFITLSVESSVIPIEDVIFEHRLYLPSIGLIIAFVSAIFYYIPYFSSFNLQPSSFFSHHASRITVLLLATVVLSLSIAAYQRNAVWKDEMSLWTDVVNKSPEKARPYCNLAVAYNNKKQLHKVIENYTKAIALKPNYAYAYNNRGNAYVTIGFYDKALADFTIAISIKPDFAEAYNNRGIFYSKIGNYDKSVEDYIKAIAIKPDFAGAYTNRGNALDARGETNKAIEDYNKALTINPKYGDAYFNRGITYMRIGLLSNAKNDFHNACSLGNRAGCTALNSGLFKPQQKPD